MDLYILEQLQQFRHATPFLDIPLEFLSYIAEGPGLAAIMLLVYWALHKRIGMLSFFSFALSGFVCHAIKNVVCVYRPWIRDAGLVPPASVLKGAGGYSFPSGHSAAAASSLGSIGWSVRKKSIIVLVVAILLIAIIMFSRLYLSVHTPQDVLVGALLGLIFIGVSNGILLYVEKEDERNPGHNKDIIISAIVIIITIAVMVFLTVKSYPMDYINGELIVDPISMQKGVYSMAGVTIALMISWNLERRFVGFSTSSEDLTMKKRIIRIVVGLIVVGVFFGLGHFALKAFLPTNPASFGKYFLIAFSGIFIAPAVFNTIEKKGKANGNQGKHAR